MVKTQIQLPDALYRDIKRLAELKGWSLAETFRRAAERFMALHPHPLPKATEWHPPTSSEVGWRGLGHSEIRSRALEDAELTPPGSPPR
jgi:hypothetical protein